MKRNDMDEIQGTRRNDLQMRAKLSKGTGEENATWADIDEK